VSCPSRPLPTHAEKKTAKQKTKLFLATDVHSCVSLPLLLYRGTASNKDNINRATSTQRTRNTHKRKNVQKKRNVMNHSVPTLSLLEQRLSFPPERPSTSKDPHHTHLSHRQHSDSFPIPPANPLPAAKFYLIPRFDTEARAEAPRTSLRKNTFAPSKNVGPGHFRCQQHSRATVFASC